MTDKIVVTLDKLFQQHRLVFWYDDKVEMKELFASLEMPDIEKLTIDNNEFGIKCKVLIDQPTQKFLIYQPSGKPNDNENWLLDLNLAYYEFHTEASSLYLQDLGLPQEFKSLIQEHEEFFTSSDRLQKLKDLLEEDDRESKVRLKMLSIICSCDADWEKVWYSLFSEQLTSKSDRYKNIIKHNLDQFLWKAAERGFGYQSPDASIKDLLIHLFKDNFQRSITGGKTVLSKDAYLFVNRWKENTKAQQFFQQWSDNITSDLGVEEAVQNLTAEALLESDTYQAIDKKIILDIKDYLLKETLSNQTLQEWIDKRKTKFFYSKYENLYQALSYGSTLSDEIRKSTFKILNAKEGFEKYAKQIYKIDGLYRKYIYYSNAAEHQNTLKELTLKIEKAYSNSYLLKLGDEWQNAINELKVWKINGIIPQRQFYNTYIKKYINKETRTFVIISDALRYESAAELREIILREDRYTAELSSMLGSVPSYTQLGMASLLPNKEVTFQENSDIVYVNGMSSQGTPNRTKILQSELPESIAITAEEFLKMNAKTEGRDFIKPYQVLYIYHNGIDKIGDDKTSEGKVFEATEDEFVQIVKIIKQIANMNGTNMIITADHGYLYQHNRLDESDFTEFEPNGDIYRASRRFVIGKNLGTNPVMQKFKGEEAGFADDTEILLPKSINRLRLQGAGSRFVHGGASLQEIVIPVIEISKKRKSDVEFVDVDIISGSSNITSNSFGVSFYQKQPLADKILQRQLKAGIYSANNKLISDVVTLLFNSIDPDSVAREKRHTFLLTSEASKYNGQDVQLRMEEQIEGTTQYKIYKTNSYRMLIAFSSEFDD
ncbi:MAG: BREX-1 system phosphatase PglZ type A [Bacteroidetes bacterium]|nr:BREX-1 system phosphatase PglZ type A [Bacteroidota bacterium]